MNPLNKQPGREQNSKPDNGFQNAPPGDETDDDALIPGTMFTQRQARLLRHAVVIMGLALVAGFATLIGIIAYRASQPSRPGPAPQPAIAAPGASIPAPVGRGVSSYPVAESAGAAGKSARTARSSDLPRHIKGLVPRGAKLVSSTIDGNRLLLILQTRGKNLKLVLIDLDRWKITGEALLQQGH